MGRAMSVSLFAGDIVASASTGLRLARKEGLNHGRLG